MNIDKLGGVDSVFEAFPRTLDFTDGDSVNSPRMVHRPRIKKIPPELRRKRFRPSIEPEWYKRTIRRLKEDSQYLRSSIQLAFLLLVIWIGIEFTLFVRWGTTGGAAGSAYRPPGVEGFLPISALISLKYWLETGIVNSIHPSGLFILAAILLTGLVLKKAFCSWLCPIGTISESLWMLGARLFGRNLALPRFLDYPLRAVKYLLLGFFVWTISQMDTGALKSFIESPYNRVADIKMFFFFTHITSFAAWTIVVLVLLSVVVKNFWCRYLCPYGALLGALSWLSPLKITRNKSTCVDCELCTKACPAGIKVHAAGRVWSDECTACMKCVEVCPVIDTLDIRTSVPKLRVPPWVFGVLVAGVFVGITGLAMLTGHWQTSVSQGEYLHRFPEIDSPLYQHFQGRPPADVEHE